MLVTWLRCSTCKSGLASGLCFVMYVGVQVSTLGVVRRSCSGQKPCLSRPSSRKSARGAGVLSEPLLKRLLLLLDLMLTCHLVIFSRAQGIEHKVCRGDQHKRRTPAQTTPLACVCEAGPPLGGADQQGLSQAYEATSAPHEHPYLKVPTKS